MRKSSSRLLIAAIAAVTMLCAALGTRAYRHTPMSRTNRAAIELVDSLLPMRHTFDARCEAESDSLLAACVADTCPSTRYELACRLYRRCHLYSFDRARRAADLMVGAAYRMGTTDAVVEARVCRGYNLARSGFYREALDTLMAVGADTGRVSPRVRADYYIKVGRVCHDLADYTSDSIYTPHYNRLGNSYLRRSLSLTPDPVLRAYVQGKVALKSGRVRVAERYYLEAIALLGDAQGEQAGIMLSTLAHIYRRLGHADKALHYYALAAQNDIRHAFLDAVAMRGLAEIMFYHYSDADRSSRYINIAIANAQRYGTRSRINLMGSLMPVFVGQKMRAEHRMNVFLMSLAATVIVLSLFLAVVMMRYQQRNRQLHASEHALVHVNGQLRKANDELTRSNALLNEANKMKNTYLGRFLDEQSALAIELDDFAIVANQKISSGQTEQLRRLIAERVEKHNRKRMLADFDHTFMTLFPSFLTGLNALLLPEHRMSMRDGGELPAQVRIFALIRLGITDNNQIARALGYSYNTVHNYRVRVRNMAFAPADFERNVLSIGL